MKVQPQRGERVPCGRAFDAREIERAPSIRIVYGHAFERVQTQSALRSALVAALARPGCTVIDAVVSPHGAAEEQARVLETLSTAGLGI